MIEKRQPLPGAGGSYVIRDGKRVREACTRERPAEVTGAPSMAKPARPICKGPKKET